MGNIGESRPFSELSMDENLSFAVSDDSSMYVRLFEPSGDGLKLFKICCLFVGDFVHLEEFGMWLCLPDLSSG
jgi:hypothetical protein